MTQEIIIRTIGVYSQPITQRWHMKSKEEIEKILDEAESRSEMPVKALAMQKLLNRTLELIFWSLLIVPSLWAAEAIQSISIQLLRQPGPGLLLKAILPVLVLLVILVLALRKVLPDTVSSWVLRQFERILHISSVSIECCLGLLAIFSIGQILITLCMVI